MEERKLLSNKCIIFLLFGKIIDLCLTKYVYIQFILLYASKKMDLTKRMKKYILYAAQFQSLYEENIHENKTV